MNRLLALIMLACALALPALPVHAVSDDRKLFDRAQFAKPSVIKALIEGGANPNARDSYGFSSLHRAAESDESYARSVIMVLIEGGADPNARNELDQTPLHIAAEYNDNPSVPSVIKALIEGGADRNARDYRNMTPFDHAKNNEALKGTDALRLLSGESPADALFEAAESGIPSKVKAALAAGPAAALFEAAASGTASEVKAALAAGADPGARNRTLGNTPLHVAATFNANPSVIVALIEGGADPGARDAAGETPLHNAALYNANPSVIVALIEGGADPGRSEDGTTPFDYAKHNEALKGTDALRLLSGESPADASRLSSGESPSDYSLYLFEAAAQIGHPSVIKGLIEGGADPNARMGGNGTPLHVAALESSNPSVIVALIEGGADIGARDDDGMTAFDYAKENEALKGTDAYWLLNEGRLK